MGQTAHNAVRVRLIGSAYRIKDPLTTLRREAADRRLGRPANRVGDDLGQIEARLRAYLGSEAVWPPYAQWLDDGQRPLYWATRALGTDWWCARLGISPPEGRGSGFDEGRTLTDMAQFIGERRDMPARAEWVQAGLGLLYDRARARRGIPWYAERLGVTYVPPAPQKSATRRRWTDELIAGQVLSLAGPGGEMPTLLSLRRTDRGLSKALERHPLGYFGWADRLGLSVTANSGRMAGKRGSSPRP